MNYFATFLYELTALEEVMNKSIEKIFLTANIIRVV